MRNICALILMISLSGAAFASPRAEKACEYFSSHISIEFDVAAAPLAPIPTPVFELVNVSLNRYALYATVEEQLEFGVVTPKDEILPTTHAAWVLTCLVDQIDRRVLQVVVMNGPSVGLTKPLSNGISRKLNGVKSSISNIGNEIHQGKY